jgi:mannitol/fructose-specific phosphotransferase system IIA component (Ntr-type)
VVLHCQQEGFGVILFMVKLWNSFAKAFVMHKTPEKQKNTLKLTSFFSEEDILVQQENLHRNALIRLMLEHLAKRHGLQDVDAYYNAVIERENMENTIIADGIAVPHGRLDGLPKPLVCVATSEEGIQFHEGGGKPVHLIMIVLIPRDKPAFYLQILRALATIMRDPDAPKDVATMKTPQEVMKYFERSGMTLPSHICAADIMVEPSIILRSNDSLKTAIDCFISKNISEIPVVDRDEDMVGVVSARALLRVCLPDYLLWMNDLSPIINFEPFANVLRKEQSAWLSDILGTTYSHVQVDAPAVSVAAELTRNNTSRCYVLNDKKLVGVIDLPVFLHKVFRE